MSPDFRPQVLHVGRSGDVPGGMTQVVNAYLAWSFEHVDVDVIPSRGDPGDHITAARLFSGAMWRVWRLSRRRFGPQPIIVVHLSERGSFVREGTIARWAARLGLPVVAHLHGSEFAAFERSNGELVGRVLRSARRIISLSDETTEVCTRHVDRERIALVPNAIPAGTPGAKEKVVVFGGVVSLRKGIDVLQDAWRQVSPQGWRLVVAGPVRDEHLVDRSLPGAEFVGSLDHASLMRELDRAEIAVLPSRDEAMPMFILEGMARRACVISTSVGGIPAVLGDGCGIVVRPGHAGELTAALRAATRDEDLRENVAQAGWNRFRDRYSAEAVFPRVESIWLEAAAGSRTDQQVPA